MTEQERQDKIIRQSQLKLVLDWSQTCGRCLTSKELVKATDIFVEYVNNGYNKEIGKKLDALDKYLSNK